jgi:hypothetical protein
MSMLFSGKFIVFALIVLTGVVGALFIFMGPKALQTNPGVFHLGIRYADEFGIEFTRYPKGGPGAVLEIIGSKGQIVERFDGLVMGRNLIPIDTNKFQENTYRLKISSNDYHTQVIPAHLKNKTFSPTTDATALNLGQNTSDTHYDFSFRDNLLGVRLYPLKYSVD